MKVFIHKSCIVLFHFFFLTTFSLARKLNLEFFLTELGKGSSFVDFPSYSFLKPLFFQIFARSQDTRKCYDLISVNWTPWLKYTSDIQWIIQVVQINTCLYQKSSRLFISDMLKINNFKSSVYVKNGLAGFFFSISVVGKYLFHIFTNIFATVVTQ